MDVDKQTGSVGKGEIRSRWFLTQNTQHHYDHSQVGPIYSVWLPHLSEMRSPVSYRLIVYTRMAAA